MRLLPIALLLCAAVLPAQDDGTDAPRAGGLVLDKLLDWERVSSPRFSPDGERIVYTRSWTDKINDRMQSALWLMNRDGSGQRFLAEGSGARWSPDGTRLVFTKSGEPKGSQIHVLHLDDRSVTQVTHLTESPSNVRWSPDGRSLAFNMQVAEQQGFPIKLPKKPKGAKWAPEPTVITRLSYRRDRSGYRKSGFRHIFVVDATGGTARQVTLGDYDHGSPEWSARGEEIFFSGLRVDDADWQTRESDVYAVNVGSGAVRQLTDRSGPDSGPVASPDGKLIAYTGYDKTTDTYNVAQIHVMFTDGTGHRALNVRQDRPPSSLMWSKNSDAIYYSVREQGHSHVYRVSLDGDYQRLTGGDEQWRLSDLDAGGAVLGTLTSPQKPADIAIRDPRRGRSVQLTHVNDDILAGVQLGDVESFRTKSKDGLEVQGWIVKPPSFDPSKKYPMILQIHGGPHGMYGVNFDFERQNHAANGYVLVYTNPRGSVGYGKEFGNAINNAYPGKDYDDLMACVDYVIGQGYIDAGNLFVYGGSGGGVLTCWIVGHTDRFRAAVSMFPVTNWISFVGTTDGPYWYTNFRQLPWENIDEHWQRSPLKYVGNVTTPTMLITGELDLRTPMAQTEEYYQALKLRKVDTVMVRVPDEYHGAAGRHISNRLRRILYVRGWFDKYREQDEAAAEASAGK